MKKYFALAALPLLLNCTPGNHPSDTKVVVATSISLNKTSIAFNALNLTETLTPIVSPAGSTDKLVWLSSDTCVATVTDGVVKSIAPGIAEITVYCGRVYAKCSVTVEVAATSISLSKHNLNLLVGESETLQVIVQPTNTTDKLEWSSSANNIATVKDGTITAISPGKATIIAKIGSRTAPCYVEVSFKFAAVDLGLSVKWANANLGSDFMCDYGDYYAWGETELKSDYSFSTYKWCKGSDYTLTKYNTKSAYGTADNKTILEPNDDIAHIRLGGMWRMPTSTECRELKTECTWTRTSVLDNGTWHKVVRVTGPNGNSIIFPLAGCYVGRSNSKVGDYFFCWSASLCVGSEGYPSEANALYMSYSDNTLIVAHIHRAAGNSVRPVTQ